MVAPLIIAGAIGAGASLLGGLKGSKDAQKARESDAALQREFAQYGIRWRVEDAKAAGLHPLYAMGAQSLPSFQPSFQTDTMGPAIADAGQNVARAIGAQMTAEERQQHALGLRLLESQIAETDARRDYYLSEAARNAQAGVSAQTFPLQMGGPITVGELDASDAYRGMTNVEPTVTYSRSGADDSVAASSTPLWRSFEVRPGFQMLLPGGQTGDASEALESLGESPLLMMATLMENQKRNPRFLREVSDAYIPGLEWLRRAATDLMEAGSRLRPSGGYRTGGGF